MHICVEFGNPDRLFVSLIRLTLERARELCARGGVRGRACAWDDHRRASTDAESESR